VLQLYAVFLSRQGMVPAVRAFVDYLVEVLDADKNLHQECPLKSDIDALIAKNGIEAKQQTALRTKAASNIETA
jgi:hypothetical protein